MELDDGMQIDTAEQTPRAATDKGKGKAVATELNEHYDKDNLPWYAHAVVLSVDRCSQKTSRVEKYRPVTLDDVVSHKDITGTSE